MACSFSLFLFSSSSSFSSTRWAAVLWVTSFLLGLALCFERDASVWPRSYGHFTSPTPSMSPRGIFNKTHPLLCFTPFSNSILPSPPITYWGLREGLFKFKAFPTPITFKAFPTPITYWGLREGLFKFTRGWLEAAKNLSTVQYVTAEWEPAFLKQALLPREASKWVPIPCEFPFRSAESIV